MIAEDHLYDLLPAVYRMRDRDQGFALRDLLRTIAAQAAVIEADIAAQYDDWFVETCAPWVLPYIGDLVGWSAVPQAAVAWQGLLSARLSPRREIANTVAHRRRKGAAAFVADLAADVSGYPTRAVEAYRGLARLQHLRHLQPLRGQTADLRDPTRLARLDGPFDPFAHVLDVRRARSAHAPGRHSLGGVGVFAHRLLSLGVTRTPALQQDDVGAHCYSFNVLGADTQLMTRPLEAPSGPDDASELGLPVPITRALLAAPRGPGRARLAGASPAICGEAASLAIFARNWPRRGAPQPVPADQIISADLNGWSYRPPRDHVLVDPVRGRMVFPPNQRPDRVAVTYRYGAPALIGGGEYVRPAVWPRNARRYRVYPDGATLPAGADDAFATLDAALTRWRQDSGRQDGPRVGVVELVRSGVYSGPAGIRLAAGTTLHIRAADRTRPVVRILDRQPDRPDGLLIRGRAGSRAILDGLIITGRGVIVDGRRRETGSSDVCEVVVEHCTLVPGWSLDCDCDPRRPSEPSIVLDNTTAKLTVRHSIVGAIRIAADEVRTDPTAISIRDSILDATDRARTAISSVSDSVAFATLEIARATVIGEVRVHAVAAAENTLFASQVTAARRQLGCMRYSFVPHGSRTPRRHRCQPDLALASIDPALPLDARQAERERILESVTPQFESERYGSPAYGRLVVCCSEALARGADDEGEMGAYHDLFEPQRLASLNARLDETMPADMQAGVIFAT